jgi:signal peptidase
MEPVIPLGAAIVATPVGADSLVVGDIVSLKVGVKQSVFTHRITRLVERDGATWLATKGDANASPDPSLIPATAVIGRVTVIVPWAGYLITLLGSLQGIIFLVSLGVFVLAGAWFLETIEDDLGEALRRRAGAGLGPLVPGVREPASEPGAAG